MDSNMNHMPFLNNQNHIQMVTSSSPHEINHIDHHEYIQNQHATRLINDIQHSQETPLVLNTYHDCKTILIY